MMGGSAFPNFNPALHSLRGLAACAVMLFHWEQFFPAFGALVQSLVPANSLLDPTVYICLLYTSPSPRDVEESRMPSSA